MATGDGWTSRLLAGLAQHIAAAGIAIWRPTGGYQASEVGIVIRGIPTSPDRIITLAPYPVSSTPGLADITQGVQIRLRGTSDPRVVEDLADSVFELLDSAGRLTLGGIAVVDIYRQSYAALGADGNSRWEMSHNYYVEAMRPTNNRTI
ncbi:minor capsid protein [Micromonospora sp. HUAS LYJ1]|uniref:minor capsid protein n=1 Tax=Micromonospora sp. HUAS LYJ1 TaxID=3061626 RepID=UPI002673BCA6|nr:minor capsid protein [Micromonospora sp. HUAS LYJ1]WKU08012.1 minor capsid protein [Micromonospora sp. HUAS LYJ1]